MARPSSYQPRVAAKVLAELAEGKSLRAVCDEPGMPARTTVLRWLAAREDFRQGYDEARQVGTYRVVDDIDQMLDDLPRLVREAHDSGVNENALVQALRTQLDGKKWLLSKIMPSKFGDRIATEVSGPGGAPLVVEADPGRLALALHSILTAAARKEGRVVDHEPSRAEPVHRQFDPQSGQVVRQALAPPPVEAASLLLGSDDPAPPIDPDNQMEPEDPLRGGPRFTPAARRKLVEAGFQFPPAEPTATATRSSFGPEHPAWRVDDRVVHLDRANRKPRR